ncbi:MAG TPA: hypothetical protein VK828_08805 [Terriglobales bacterium]|jgi:hypothetical protein|nr:hypothetical protein [Terriglobales bacterium]
MIPSYRQDFNARFTQEKYDHLQREMASRCGMEVPFALCETPCFFPDALVRRMAEDGKSLILQLVENQNYRARSEASIPAQFRVPNESPHPMFIQVDFGLVRDSKGDLQPKLVELQAFPSLYAYQPVLAQAYSDVFQLDTNLRYFLNNLDSTSYAQLLRDAIVAGHDPANVVLMEVHPEEQKTRPDFLLTEKLLGIRTVCITKIRQQGRQLFYEENGKQIPIERIYNRTIVDELERKDIAPPFDFRDDLEVEWAGHPNWYFRISKYSISYLKHPSVPRTWFLDQLPEVPADLENFVLKPLYSFAGLGVVIAPSRADIDAIPSAKRSTYILQERLNFTPVVETPYGSTKVELRIMYVWLDTLVPVLTIVRMGRGLMMGVDHNKNMKWVGSSAALIR